MISLDPWIAPTNAYAEVSNAFLIRIESAIDGVIDRIDCSRKRGDYNEKISVRFRSHVSWCGIDVCVDAWGSECGGREGDNVL